MKNKVSDIVNSKENLNEIFRFFLISFMLILLVSFGICKLKKKKEKNSSVEQIKFLT
jgi:hypothetical protein